MSSVAELATSLATNAGKIPMVTFARIAKHMPGLSAKEGRYISVDVDIVTVRQAGDVNSTIHEAEAWLKQQAVEQNTGRLPIEHLDYYRRAYDRWKQGQEMPLDGTPIKGWAIIGPAQQDLLIHIGIRTVEDLATMNSDGRQRIGIGAQSLQNKAMAWLAQAQDKGPLTLEMASLKDKNTLLEANLLTMQRQIEELKAAKPVPAHAVDAITIEDIMEEEPAKRGPGRPRKES